MVTVARCGGLDVNANISISRLATAIRFADHKTRPFTTSVIAMMSIRINGDAGLYALRKTSLEVDCETPSSSTIISASALESEAINCAFL